MIQTATPSPAAGIASPRTSLTPQLAIPPLSSVPASALVAPTPATPMSNALHTIIRHKHDEVDAARKLVPVEEMAARARAAPEPRNFFRRIADFVDLYGFAVIAEIKRKSPSAGWLRPEYENPAFSPIPIAQGYQRAGAAAISCLTDQRFFAGDNAYIQLIRNSVNLPVLRKDFIVDPWQVYESRAIGADAILLIADVLPIGRLLDLLILATELRLTTLLEVHDTERLLEVRPHVGFPHPGYVLLGVNNRDLTTMTTDLNHTLRMLDLIEDKSILVSESGISQPAHLRRLRDHGVKIALIGEHLMRTENPGAALADLIGDL